MNYETDRWPLRKARYFTRWTGAGRRPVNLIVIHDMEWPESSKTAERCAEYFATMPDGRKASAHICVDSDSIIQCVKDNDVAYAAPGANHDGIQIELAGFGAQSRESWLDAFGRLMLPRAADAVAQYCLKYDIPPRHLTTPELAAGKRGIVGHDQVSRAFRKSTHTDPRPNFPWDWFMDLVREAYERRRPD